MFSFTRLVTSKVQDTANIEKLDLGPGNKYTRSLEGLTSEKATFQDADRQKWMWHSLVPRPLPDFISQPWRKIGRRPGSKTTSRTGNGGLGQYVCGLGL